MSKRMRVAFFQYTPVFNDVEANFEAISKLIKSNGKAMSEVDLVVFPEYCFSGSLSLETLPLYREQMKEFNLEGRLVDLSREFPLATFIFGSALLQRGKDCRNITLAIKDGELLAEYAKKALIYSENFICKSTDEYPVFTVGGWRIGIAICWDVILPEVFRHYTSKVDLVVVPSLWGLGGNELQEQYSLALEKTYYKELCVARAYENAFNLLFVNSVGDYSSPHYSDTMMGGSLVVSPPEGVVQLINDDDPKKLHIYTIDSVPLKQYRESYATDRDYEYYKSRNIF